LINKNNFWKNKKVFITGHTGFKGSWIFFYLIKKGAKVHGYSLNYARNSNIFSKKIYKNKQTINDINNYRILEKSILKFKPHVIIHLAAKALVLNSYRESYQTFYTNIVGTLNILEISKRLKNLKSLCVITTDKVYDEKFGVKFFNEEDRLGGKDPYSSSKVSVEIIVNSYYESFYKEKKISLFSVRAGNVIGGGDWSESRLIPDIVRSSRNKKILKLRNPFHVRPWQHVLDVTNGYLKLIEFSFNKNLNGGWNIGPKRKNEKNVLEMVKIFNKKLNFNYTISKVNKIRKYESFFLQLDNKKILKTIGWKCKLDLNKTINWAVEWYISRNKNVLSRTQYQIDKYIKLYDSL